MKLILRDTSVISKMARDKAFQWCLFSSVIAYGTYIKSLIFNEYLKQLFCPVMCAMER